jgi:hypothetical protein
LRLREAERPETWACFWFPLDLPHTLLMYAAVHLFCYSSIPSGRDVRVALSSPSGLLPWRRRQVPVRLGLKVPPTYLRLSQKLPVRYHGGFLA